MSFLGLIPQMGFTSVVGKPQDNHFLTANFVDRLEDRLKDMQKFLAEDERLEVLAFLPSGKAVDVELVSYEDPSMIALHGREQDTGKACSLLVHQASLQLLVSVEKLQAGQRRQPVSFLRR